MRFDVVCILAGLLLLFALAWRSSNPHLPPITTYSGHQSTIHERWYGEYEMLSRLIQLQPQSRDLRLQRAIKLALLGRFVEAEADLAVAHKLDPKATSVIKTQQWLEGQRERVTFPN
jgi:lipoprotein NlpI